MKKSILQYAPRGSIGVRNYADNLARAVSKTDGVQGDVRDNPQRYGDGGHFHISNSTRRLLPYLCVARHPVLLTIHDLMPRSRVLRPFLTPVQCALLRRFPAVVHSELAQSWLKKYGIGRHVHVLAHASDPLGLDDGRVEALRARFVAAGERMVVAAGILNMAKSIPDVIRAMSGIEHMTLVLVGRVGDSETETALAGAGDNVRHLSNPDDDVFAETIAAADYLLNFRRDSVGEASGPVALAYAARVPIFGYAIGTQAEEADPNDLLFPLDRPIPDCLRELARTPVDGCRPTRQQGPPTWEQAGAQYLDLYDRYGLTES